MGGLREDGRATGFGADLARAFLAARFAGFFAFLDLTGFLGVLRFAMFVPAFGPGNVVNGPPCGKHVDAAARALLGKLRPKGTPMPENAGAGANPSGLRAIYAWMLRAAAGRHAWTAMAVIAFAEASFFPIPPDIMLVPMVLANRSRAFLVAAWCTLWSVLGGTLGYTIGSLLFDSVGQWLIHAYGMGGGIEAFRQAYAKYGYWIMVQGLTPIPYKLVTIASGFAGFNFGLFMLFSAITRGVRFFAETSVLYIFGEPVKRILEKYLEIILVAFLVLIVAGFLLVRYIV
jgi:membrane protein YqaA with SNARE-associated domain